ncbi:MULTISPECIES: metallophosphoesterase [Rhizobium/Agrobacterium group]|uniref:metallophosphoesterase n=1 Tax=Rhizobium/Agrobacterium group TaxID=227290 RepID=UPI000B3F902F|nr:MULTISPECIES: metallophosphoesterase [Rhizobium/Agrobacterium group]MCF1481879.1 metallophosphoesterase [Allorhizobium ampelinum]NSZ42348.1 metallophosphoesterase [Agrobacterium vitis]NTA26056.1 metallophosphoesterase [Allorhizobium ampelinum]OVE95376.1 metallophosphoesterase [Allorhizobium ampelinum]
MFHLIFGLPWLIVAIRFIQPLPWIWSAKVALAVLLLIASQYHFFSRLSSGSVFSPEFPRPLIIAFNLLFGAIILLAVFQIVLDVISLVIMLFKGNFPSIPASLRYALGGVALCLSAYAVSQAIRVPPLKDIEIPIAGLPPAFDGYRIVQLTDLHISRLFPARWTEEVVSKTNGLDADLIVITGDFIDGDVASRQDDVAPLANLRARDGVYAIPGNHEYFFNFQGWMAHLATLKMNMLSNAHAVITKGDAKLALAGVTDRSAAAHGAPAPDLAAALQGTPADAPIILLDHQPMSAAKAAASGIALQLSGHTHGGMVLGLDRLVARANNGFVSGRYGIGGMTLYVNNGTALWPGFALRLGVPSELTRITLRAKTPSGI